MQPRENDDLIPRLDALEPVEKGWLEDKQSVGRTLIALFWGQMPDRLAETRPTQSPRVCTDLHSLSTSCAGRSRTHSLRSLWTRQTDSSRGIGRGRQ
jgi:hypothetical protein